MLTSQERLGTKVDCRMEIFARDSPTDERNTMRWQLHSTHTDQNCMWLKYKEQEAYVNTTHTHTRLTALFPGLPRWAGTRKAKPIWILLKQETVGGNGIIWAICKSASHSRQITMPVLHHSKAFYRPDALPAAKPTASKHWRQNVNTIQYNKSMVIRRAESEVWAVTRGKDGETRV